MKGKEDDDPLMKKPLSSPSMSQESIASVDFYQEEENDDVNSTSSLGTPQSKLNVVAVSSDSCSSTVMPVMMTKTTTLEEQVANLMKMVEGLSKTLQDRDAEVVYLRTKVDNMGESSQAIGDTTKAPEIVEITNKQQETQKSFQVSTDGSIHVDQLKDFILEAIKDKYQEAPKSSLTHSKPYTRMIDQLKMPAGYQPPKF